MEYNSVRVLYISIYIIVKSGELQELIKQFAAKLIVVYQYYKKVQRLIGE